MLKALATIMIVFFAVPAYAGDSHIAIVKSVTGTVNITRHAQTITAIPGMQLMIADRITSDKQSSAGIIFIDGTRITVGASSEIDIRHYLFDPRASQYDFSVYLRKGESIYSSGKLGKLAPEKVKFKTPRATVGIRGTRFIVKVD